MTLSLNATYPSTNTTDYDVHSLQGHLMANATSYVQQNLLIDNRHFILSKSTFAGSGKYAAQSSGAAKGEWEDLKLAVSKVMSMNMFGIPMSGADVCHYTNYTDDVQKEMCARWMQLGSMMPLFRYNSPNNLLDMYDQFSTWYNIAQYST